MAFMSRAIIVGSVTGRYRSGWRAGCASCLQTSTATLSRFGISSILNGLSVPHTDGRHESRSGVGMVEVGG